MDTNRGSGDGFLLMDRVESTHHVDQSVCEAEKHPLNPVLPLGDVQEWDSTHCGPWSSPTVLYDDEDGLFKAWYAGSDITTRRWWAMGYAESEDGVNWHKPVLGLHEYNGSKQNNIVLDGRGPIIKDDAEPDPAKRFKGIKRPFSKPMPVGQRDPEYVAIGARANYSPDGIHWTEGAPHRPAGVGQGRTARHRRARARRPGPRSLAAVQGRLPGAGALRQAGHQAPCQQVPRAGARQDAGLRPRHRALPPGRGEPADLAGGRPGVRGPPHHDVALRRGVDHVLRVRLVRAQTATASTACTPPTSVWPSAATASASSA